MARETERKELTSDELEAQQAADLPDREAMTLIAPPSPMPILTEVEQPDPGLIIGPPPGETVEPGVNM
jgi:hypothetical protein